MDGCCRLRDRSRRGSWCAKPLEKGQESLGGSGEVTDSPRGRKSLATTPEIYDTIAQEWQLGHARMKLAIASASLLLLIAACSSGGQPSRASIQTPVPTPTSVPTPTQSCPLVAAVCGIAAALREAVLVKKDFDWIVQNYPPQTFIRPGARPQGLGGPYPLCDGAKPTEERRGYLVAHLQSEGEVLTPEAYKETLSGWVEGATAATGDRDGAAAARLYSIGCSNAPTCAGRIAVVFSKIPGEVPYRSELIFVMDRSSGSPLLTTTAVGSSLDPTLLRGGAVQGFLSSDAIPMLFTPLGP